MTLRDNLAAVLEKIREAINAIDAAEAEVPADPAAAEAAESPAEQATDVAAEEPAAADVTEVEPVHHGGPASV